MNHLYRNVKYPVKGRGIEICVWVFFSLAVIVTTVFNVAAVGYELVPIFSSAYNDTLGLWYEKLIPTSIRPQTRSCQPSVIQLNEG